ncbi:single stranded-binding protein c31A [Dermatophagoides pteronyssinus]|uniref:single stranded-binding protein c31A n=1 Tax=Dermatophagoides pteronyssinus TaxID=6956 RepID=UPI003F660E74
MSSKKKPQQKASEGSDDESTNTLKLSNNRFLTVSEFKNKVRVDIREFYLNEDGERKPGKKGISLSMDEWKKIVENMDKIKKMIKDQGDSDSE